MGTLGVMLHVSIHDEKAKVTLQGKESEQMTAAQMTASSHLGQTYSAKVNLADGHKAQEAVLHMGMHFRTLFKNAASLILET